MSTILKINKEVEKIIIPSEDGSDDVILEVFTDDKSITQTLHQVGNAMDRFAALQSKLDKAANEGEVTEAQQTMARLFKRSITAIVGKDGWDKILCFIGDGKPADPANNIITLGEVFAALVTWLYEHCTSKQLRDAGIYFKREEPKIKAQKKRVARKRK